VSPRDDDVTEGTARPDDRRDRRTPWRAARPWLLQACLATAMVVGYFLLPLDPLGPDRPTLSWTLFAVALLLVALLLLQQIRDVLVNRPQAHPALVIPLLMCLTVLVFSAAYYALAKHPGEFKGIATRMDALYFTTVTLATVGGDITPLGQAARVVTVLQILYSFVFLTAAATALTRHVRDQAVRRLERGRQE
jgi:voltage-gated potassium channel